MPDTTPALTPEPTPAASPAPTPAPSPEPTPAPSPAPVVSGPVPGRSWEEHRRLRHLGYV
jgi:hypothetical protein